MSRKPIGNQKESLDNDDNTGITEISVEESKETAINRHVDELLKKKFDTNLDLYNSDDVLATFQSWTRFS